MYHCRCTTPNAIPKWDSAENDPAASSYDFSRGIEDDKFDKRIDGCTKVLIKFGEMKKAA
jgi:hypothetical protein